MELWKITYKWVIFQQAMFDCQRVVKTNYVKLVGGIPTPLKDMFQTTMQKTNIAMWPRQNSQCANWNMDRNSRFT